jgi:hypothetical protein
MGLHADDWFLVRPQTASGAFATFAGDWNTGARGIGGFYRPWVRVSFLLDGYVHGGAAWGSHLTNVLLFGGVLLGVWVLAQRLHPGPLTGFIAAALVLLSPLKNEAVFWVSGRTDLLATLFSIWALVAWVRWLDDGPLRSAFVALGLMLLAFMSKETALPLAVVLPLAWIVLASGEPARRITVGVVLPITLAAGFVVFRQCLLGGLGGYRVDEPRSVSSLLTNFLHGVSAFACPWQSSSLNDSFSPLVGIVGVGAVVAYLWIRGFPRVEFWLAAAVALCLAPIVFAPPAPADGTRLLLLPLVLASALLAGTVTGWVGRPILLLALLSLQPWNLGGIGEFIRAGRANDRIVAEAMSFVAEDSGAATFVVPVPPRTEPRRILDPGLALDQAIVARWLSANPDGHFVNLLHSPDGIPAIGLQRPGAPLIRIAPTLYPEMETGIILRQRAGQLLAVPFSAAPEGSPLELAPGAAIAAQLAADARQSPAAGVLRVGEWEITQPFHRTSATESRCWLDTLGSPAESRGTPLVSASPVGFQLQRITLRRFDLETARRILP